MVEQLVTFETAKLAKEKGFIIQQEQVYTDRGALEYLTVTIAIRPYIYAPTQSLLQSWLRSKGIDITILILGSNDYEYIIHRDRVLMRREDVRTTPDNYKDVYSDALEKALYEALKLIP